MTWLRLLSLRRARSGQAMVEYAVILVLVAVAIVVALAAFGQGVLALYQHVLDQMHDGGIG